jgi:aspartyl/asparaginyl-tRNA synthetase
MNTQDHVNALDFHKTTNLLREFFTKKGFLEVYAQNRLSILAACEDPFNVTSFDYLGEKWPLPQTNQMWLEHELLTKPSLDKVFCFSTSYRQEKNPVPGRHNLIFPMFEFESKGGFTDLMLLLRELCEFLGFGNISSFKDIAYEDAAQKAEVSIIESDQEADLAEELGNVLLLHHFPIRTSPFWNMKFDPKTKIASKVDTLIYGMETIGAAERSCDATMMREIFYTISNGKYAETLFAKFGKDRVEKELEEFLSLDFFQRFGGGIGMTRMIRALKLQGVISDGSEKEFKKAV